MVGGDLHGLRRDGQGGHGGLLKGSPQRVPQGRRVRQGSRRVLARGGGGLGLTECRGRGEQGLQAVAVFRDHGLLVEGQQVVDGLTFDPWAGGAGGRGLALVAARRAARQAAGTAPDPEQPGRATIRRPRLLTYGISIRDSVDTTSAQFAGLLKPGSCSTHKGLLCSGFQGILQAQVLYGREHVHARHSASSVLPPVWRQKCQDNESQPQSWSDNGDHRATRLALSGRQDIALPGLPGREFWENRHAIRLTRALGMASCSRRIVGREPKWPSSTGASICHRAATTLRSHAFGFVDPFLCHWLHTGPPLS